MDSLKNLSLFVLTLSFFLAHVAAKASVPAAQTPGPTAFPPFPFPYPNPPRYKVPIPSLPTPAPTAFPPFPFPFPPPKSEPPSSGSPTPAPAAFPPFPFPFPSPPKSQPPISGSPTPAPAAFPPFPFPFPSPPKSQPPISGSPTAFPPFPFPFPNPPISQPFPIPSAPSPAPNSPVSSPIAPSDGIKAAYWPSWTAEWNPPSTIPTTYFTHLFYAFVFLNSTYQISVTQPDDQWMGNFTGTLHAKNPPAKALLSIGGANASPVTFALMASDPNNRATFIKSAIDVARKYGFDGLDLYWEYPATAQEMSDLASLLKEWRTAIDNEFLIPGSSKLLLTAAVYFSPKFFLTNQESYPAKAITKYMDFVNPMCFNYHGGWNVTATGEHALLYDSTSNISTSYGIGSWIKAGVPPEKLVMGMPLYGHTWQLKDSNVNGIGAPAVSTGPGSGTLVYTAVVDFNVQNKATVVYDEKTVSTYSYAGNSWIGYDDERSVAKKVEYAKAQGLGGYFFWALGSDKNWTLSMAASSAWETKN